MGMRKHLGAAFIDGSHLGKGKEVSIGLFFPYLRC